MGSSKRQRPEEVRSYVRDLLQRSKSFHELPPEERERFEDGLERVLAFLTDPSAGLGDADEAAPRPPLARGQAAQGTGKDFVGGAAREGGDAFEQLVSAVDFPEFVQGLITGVYESIVDSSIRQMQEYATLLQNVVKSVEQFAEDNISMEDARGFMVSSFPSALRLEPSDQGPRIALNQDLDDEGAPDFKNFLGMEDDVELDGDTEEQIVAAARLKMARQRQQHLATMVMLGINRIVVTQGEIKAAVLFDVKSKDRAVDHNRTGASTRGTSVGIRRSGGGWGSSSSSTNVSTTVASAYTHGSEHSESELETRAKLSGSVLVKFKSETFPLERLASGEEMDVLQEKGRR